MSFDKVLAALHQAQVRMHAQERQAVGCPSALPAVLAQLLCCVDTGADGGRGACDGNRNTWNLLRSHLSNLNVEACMGSTGSTSSTSAASSSTSSTAASPSSTLSPLVNVHRTPHPIRARELIAARTKLVQIEGQFDDALEAVRRMLHKPSQQFRSLKTGPTSSVTHLIELRHKEPASKRVPPSWVQVNQTKEYARWHPPAVVALLHDRAVAAEEVDAAAKLAWKR